MGWSSGGIWKGREADQERPKERNKQHEATALFLAEIVGDFPTATEPLYSESTVLISIFSHNKLSHFD